MRFGITGNPGKDTLWQPLEEVLQILNESSYAYVLHPGMHDGLVSRGMIAPPTRISDVRTFIDSADIILSFGGDGTLLKTVAELGDTPKPILGVNHGRLGFLANVEGTELNGRLDKLERGDFIVEERLVLQATKSSGKAFPLAQAMNEFTVQRAGDAGLISLEVSIDGVAMNTYWSDGLIISTPTGSTAYSLALGGPIMVPGCGSILITPIAPHSLTVRPVVLSEDSVVSIRILDEERSHIFTADGVSSDDSLIGESITVKKADYKVRLIRFHDQDYFSTLRTKLMWGARKTT